MAVARQAAATAAPARPARPTVSWPDLLSFAKACLDSAARRGGAYITRVHAALNASRQASAGGYAHGGRTNPIACQYARGHSPPPANIPAPRVEHTNTQFDQVQMPSAPATPGTERRPAKKAAHYTSARTVRKTHAFAGKSSPFVIHGVLTPPDDPTVRHDGGH